jgi:uncharacterized phage infection (PIP) family protein YhgE
MPSITATAAIKEVVIMEWGYSVDIDPLETLKIRYAMVLRDNKKLQAEVEWLQKTVNENESFFTKTLPQLTATAEENAKLRKVVKAANDGNTFALVQALAELDEEC